MKFDSFLLFFLTINISAPLWATEPKCEDKIAEVPGVTFTEDQFHEGVARNIRRLLAEQTSRPRITQEQLGKALGISKHAVRELASGRKAVTLEQATLIAATFNVPLEAVATPDFLRKHQLAESGLEVTVDNNIENARKAFEIIRAQFYREVSPEELSEISWAAVKGLGNKKATDEEIKGAIDSYILLKTKTL